MNIVFIVFLLLSLVSALISAAWAIRAYKRKNYSESFVSPLMVFTIGLFFSVLFIYLPAYYTFYEFGDNYAYIRPFCLSLTDTVRAFIVEYSYDFLLEASAELPGYIRMPYTLYTALLYIAAPLTTFGNILSLFRNFKSELRVRFGGKTPMYIMSELNDNSLMLAQSIYELNKSSKEKKLIVFAGTASDDDYNYNLLLEADKIGAVTIKKDIVHLDMCSRRSDTEMFFISDSSSQNVRQAAEVTKALNDSEYKKGKIKLFIFSDSAADAHIINSLRYDNLLGCTDENGSNGFDFRLRRIDRIRQTVRWEVPKMELFTEIRDNTLSVLIIGFGSFGLEFFKMISWYCRIDGIRLEINIIDKNEISGILGRHCPGLMALSENKSENYSVRCFSGVDASSSDIRDMLFYSGDDSEKRKTAERLKRTSAVITALGDDDLNIETSVYLVSLFDRINGIRSKKEILSGSEHPKIFSVVYDEKMYTESGESCINLTDYKETPYNIRFIGSTASRYSYRSVYSEEDEESAYAYHTEWAEINREISEELKAKGKSDEYISERYFYPTSAKDIEGLRRDYERFEYYRDSSIARALHVKAVNKYFAEKAKCRNKDGKKALCSCKGCLFIRKTEHMRWKAYVCANGDEYNEKRCPRSRTHNKIVPFEKLDIYDDMKDISNSR